MCIRDSKHTGKYPNEVRGQPRIFFPLVQHDLHAPHGDREQPETGVVEGFEIGTIGFDPGRIVDVACNQEKGKNPDRDVDVENPSPGVAVGDPAAHRWPNGWRQDGNEAIECKGLPPLLLLECCLLYTSRCV